MPERLTFTCAGGRQVPYGPKHCPHCGALPSEGCRQPRSDRAYWHEERFLTESPAGRAALAR